MRKLLIPIIALAAAAALAVTYDLPEPLEVRTTVTSFETLSQNYLGAGAWEIAARVVESNAVRSIPGVEVIRRPTVVRVRLAMWEIAQAAGIPNVPAIPPDEFDAEGNLIEQPPVDMAWTNAFDALTVTQLNRAVVAAAMAKAEAVLTP